MKPEVHSWPENHWHWPIELSHFHGVKSGGLIFTSDISAIDVTGQVAALGNITKQTQIMMEQLGKAPAPMSATVIMDISHKPIKAR